MTIPNFSYVLIPTAITDAMLTSCTVAEPASGETEWNAATSYTIGQEAIRTSTHKRYKRLVAELRALRAEVAELKSTNAAIAGHTAATHRQLVRIAPNDIVQTEVAA